MLWDGLGERCAERVIEGKLCLEGEIGGTMC